MADSTSRWSQWRPQELRSRRLRMKLRGTRSSSNLRPLGDINIDICGPSFYSPFQTPLMGPKTSTGVPMRPKSVVFCSEIQMSAAMAYEMGRSRAASASTAFVPTPISHVAHSSPLDAARKPLPHVPSRNTVAPIELPGSLLLKDKGFQPGSEYSVVHWGRGPEKYSAEFLRDIGLVDEQPDPAASVDSDIGIVDEHPTPPASVDSHDSGIGTPSDASPGSSCDMAPFFSRANASRYSVLPRFDRPHSSERSIEPAKVTATEESSNLISTPTRMEPRSEERATQTRPSSGPSEAQRVNQVFQRHIKELKQTLEERDGNVITLTNEVAELQQAYDVLQKHHDGKLASLKTLLNYLDKLRKGEPTALLHKEVTSSLQALHYLDGTPKKTGARHTRSVSVGTITSQHAIDVPAILIKPSSPTSSTQSSSEQNVAELWSRLRSKEALEKSLRTSEKQALDDVKRLLDDVELLSRREKTRAAQVQKYHDRLIDLGITITGEAPNEVELSILDSSEANVFHLDEQSQTWKSAIAGLKKSIEERDDQITSLENKRQEQISQMQSEITWLTKDNAVLEKKMRQYLLEKEDVDVSQKATIRHLSNELHRRDEEIAVLKSPSSLSKPVVACLDLSKNRVAASAPTSGGHSVLSKAHLLRSKFSTQALDQSSRSQSVASGLSSAAKLVNAPNDVEHLQRLVEVLELKRKQYKHEISTYRHDHESHKKEITNLKSQIEHMQEDQRKTKAEIDKYRSEASQKEGKLRQIIDVHRNQRTAPNSPVQSPGGRRRPSLENNQFGRTTESAAELAARAQHFVAAVRRLDSVVDDCNARVSQLLQELVSRDVREARGKEIVEVRHQLADAIEQRNSYLSSIESCLSAIAEPGELQRDRRPSVAGNGALPTQFPRATSHSWASPPTDIQDFTTGTPLNNLVELSGESVVVKSPKTGRKRSPSNLATCTIPEIDHTRVDHQSPTTFFGTTFQGPLSPLRRNPPTPLDSHSKAAPNVLENAVGMKSPVEQYQPYRPETYSRSIVIDNGSDQESPRSRSVSPRRQRTISGGNGGLRSLYQQDQRNEF